MPIFIPTPAVNGVLYAFQQSDAFAKVIIVLLLLLSMQAWTIMLDKGMTVRHARRSGLKFLNKFAACSSPLDMLMQLDQHSGPLLEVYEAGIEELADILDMDSANLDQCARTHSLPRQLSIHEVDRIRSTLERTVSAKISELERRLGLLGTAVTVSPFLGLLGTVWGVMMAFTGMAQSGRPDIGAMAPGISGALLTTVVGLLVAIPSVVGFNLLTSGVQQAITEMDNFVEDFVSVLKLQGTDEEQ
ncbi:MAG: MotA/TolQ/ExbB proton channel family protein [Lentisphaeria bacterium]